VIPDQPPVKARKDEFSTNNPSGEPGLGYEGWRARIGDHSGGHGFFRPIKSAIGAYFFANGAEADADWLSKDLAAVITERQGDRSDAYIADRLGDLPNAIAAIQAMQAAREQEELERAKQIERFQGDPACPLLISERREDAEAGWKATGYEAWACLAGMPKILNDIVPIGRKVVVLHEDVDRFAPSRRAMRKTIRRWQRQGHTVLEAIPGALSARDGSTFADLLTKAGLGAVKERIEAALTPTALPNRVPVEEARQKLTNIIETAVDDLSSWIPPPE
jgi:hypothetical protein